MSRVRRRNYFNKEHIKHFENFLGGYDRIEEGLFSLVDASYGKLNYLYRNLYVL